MIFSSFQVHYQHIGFGAGSQSECFFFFCSGRGYGILQVKKKLSVSSERKRVCFPFYVMKRLF